MSCSPSYTVYSALYAIYVLYNRMYKPIMISERHIDVRPPHECSTASKIPLCCVDAQGMDSNL